MAESRSVDDSGLVRGDGGSGRALSPVTIQESDILMEDDFGPQLGDASRALGGGGVADTETEEVKTPLSPDLMPPPKFVSSARLVFNLRSAKLPDNGDDSFGSTVEADGGEDALNSTSDTTAEVSEEDEHLCLIHI